MTRTTFLASPRALAPALLGGWLALGATGATAQPDPSFRAACSDLRAAIERLGDDDERLVTIEVVGPLTNVQSDGTLAYMFM